jgi:hypothetical protein
MDDEDELRQIATIALACHGYRLDRLTRFTAYWCEPGQHIHIVAEFGDREILLFFHKGADA